MNRYIVTEELDNERLDTVLTELMEHQHSRSYLKKLIKEECVLLNHKPATPSARVQEGDEIIIDLPENVLPDILPNLLSDDKRETDSFGIDFWTGERILCMDGKPRKQLAPHACVVCRTK